MNIASFIIVMIMLLIGSLSIATLLVLLWLWIIDKNENSDILDKIRGKR